MRLSTFRSGLSSMVHCSVLALVISALTVSCASKKPKTEEPPVSASADTQNPPTPTPAVTDKAMETDPQGSDSGKIPGLSTIFFDYDQAKLTGDARKKLAENADWIKNHPNFTIQVEGHTDSRGSIEYNLALGERRAKSVKTYLEGLGVESKRLTIISYGKEKPLDNGETEAAWSKNRRANFVPLQ